MTTDKRKKEAHVRFSEEEYSRVQVQAKAAGKSASEFIRSSVLNESAVHITDGKEVAQRLSHMHNKMIQYHSAMDRRMDELRDSVRAYTTLLQDFREGIPSSPTVQETAKLLNLRVEAAVNVIYHAYREFENRIDEKLLQIVRREPSRGGNCNGDFSYAKSER